MKGLVTTITEDRMCVIVITLNHKILSGAMQHIVKIIYKIFGRSFIQVIECSLYKSRPNFDLKKE